MAKFAVRFSMCKCGNHQHAFFMISPKYAEMYNSKEQAQQGVTALVAAEKISVDRANTLLADIRNSSLPVTAYWCCPRNVP